MCLTNFTERKKKAFLDYENKVKKVEKLAFFQRGVFMVLVKNLKYFLVIFVKIGQRNVFYDILERKKAFLHYENKKLKKVEKVAFSKKRLVHGFGQKFEIFPFFLVKM